MKITISRSGGFMGIPFTKTIDTKDLPQEKAEEIEELVSKTLQRPPGGNPTGYPPGGLNKPDRFSYTITTEDNEVDQSVIIPETELTPELDKFFKTIK